MQRYKIPFEFKFEDKIVGGLMTWKQALILSVPALVVLKLLVDFRVTLLLAFLTEFVVVAASAIVAFVKIGSDDLVVLLKKYYDFHKREKIFLNK